MELYLVRHAIAEDHGASSDEERALTEEGKARMARAARGLRKLKLELDVILSSPLRRARETAEIVAQELGPSQIEIMSELAPSVDVRAVIPGLRARARLSAVALVGHQPSLGELFSFLLTGSESRLAADFKKGGVACLEADFSGDAPRSMLKWLVTPSLLRSL